MAGDDRHWEQIQTKAFTFWANGFLPEDKKIEDLTTSFSDSLKLIALVESLTKSRILKYKTNPKLRAHYIENIHLAMQHLSKEANLNLSDYGTEDFADGNLKSILGFLWTLLRKFSVKSGKNRDDADNNDPLELSLLNWLRETLDGYEIPIRNFTTSFSDGRILCALMEKYDNTYLDYSKISERSPKENIRNALEVAESKINIPNLIDSDRMAAGNLDERTIVLYTSLIQQAYVRKFAEVANKEKIFISKQMKDIQEKMESLTLERDNLVELNGKMESDIKKSKDNEKRLLELIEQYEAQNSLLKEELEETKNKGIEYEEKINVMENILENDSKEKAKINASNKCLEEELELVKKQVVDLEEERDEISRQRDKLTLEKREVNEAIEHFKKAKHDMEVAYGDRNELTLKGLGVLSENILEHLKEMNIWKVYLGQDRVYQSEKIQSTTENSISNLHFEDQLQYLSTAMEKENLRLKELLKDHEKEIKSSRKN